MIKACYIKVYLLLMRLDIHQGLSISVGIEVNELSPKGLWDQDKKGIRGMV